MMALWSLAAACVIAGTLAPARWLPGWLPDDKWLHAAAYCLLSLPLAALVPLEWVIPGLAGLLLLGWALEWAQQWWVTGRTYCQGDLRANLRGVVLGGILGGLLRGCLWLLGVASGA